MSKLDVAETVTADRLGQWILDHLPPGEVYTDEDPGLSGALDALGAEAKIARDFLLAIQAELDVSNTTELIDAWEDVFGLPNPCDPSPPSTLADRRAAVHAALVARRGTQLSILRRTWEALGYDGIEVQYATLFRVDESAVDERLYDYGDASAVWFWRATDPGWDALRCVMSDGPHPILPAYCVAHYIDGLGANEVTLPV